MHTIAVIAFEGLSPFHLSVPCIVFGDDLLKLGAPRYPLLICGERTGPVRTMSGFNIDVEHDLSLLDEADTVILPAWRDPHERPSKALTEALTAAHARGARIPVHAKRPQRPRRSGVRLARSCSYASGNGSIWSPIGAYRRP
ncbi:hypothetical protein [Paracoccus sp. S3-43]|uniref:hypothetical protein n=1 Tax=Paracoccus sp. S3-43 TaxID=3030011 RepID=UPI0023B13889|nr:hypothetical protein [Paracoccus sp. S3-43]WEF25808.1 hypothetical protein PXD02_07840 [Paracoccus sp. S3-43]